MPRLLEGWFLYQRKDSAGWIVRYLDVLDGKWHEHRVPVEHRSKRAAESYWFNDFLPALERVRAQIAVQSPPEIRRQTIGDLADEWTKLRDKDERHAGHR